VIVTVVRLSSRGRMLEFGGAPAVNTLNMAGPPRIAMSCAGGSGGLLTGTGGSVGVTTGTGLARER
jgi:hypothetical protein